MMADINIERKGKSPLPWVLGLLALVLIAFLVMRSLGGDDEAEGGPVTDTTTAGTAAPVAPVPGDTTT